MLSHNIHAHNTQTQHKYNKEPSILSMLRRLKSISYTVFPPHFWYKTSDMGNIVVNSSYSFRICKTYIRVWYIVHYMVLHVRLHCNSANQKQPSSFNYDQSLLYYLLIVSYLYFMFSICCSLKHLVYAGVF